jgi:hypothetical protein
MAPFCAQAADLTSNEAKGRLSRARATATFSEETTQP